MKNIGYRYGLSQVKVSGKSACRHVRKRVIVRGRTWYVRCPRSSECRAYPVRKRRVSRPVRRPYSAAWWAPVSSSTLSACSPGSRRWTPASDHPDCSVQPSTSNPVEPGASNYVKVSEGPGPGLFRRIFRTAQFPSPTFSLSTLAFSTLPLPIHLSPTSFLSSTLSFRLHPSPSSVSLTFSPFRVPFPSSPSLNPPRWSGKHCKLPSGLGRTRPSKKSNMLWTLAIHFLRGTEGVKTPHAIENKHCLFPNKNYSPVYLFVSSSGAHPPRWSGKHCNPVTIYLW